jgi:KUP system potassium uptake protein
MADGILTPAVSVTSAVSGIGVAQPSVINSIVPVSIAFLIVLFFVQQFGTAKLAFTFAPGTFSSLNPNSSMRSPKFLVSFMWFLLLIGTGIYNITYYPAVFRAFDPSRAVMRTLQSIQAL